MTDEEFFLSKSSIEVFTQCTQKFDLQYIQKVQMAQSLEETQAAVFGNVIHDTLEAYFKSEKKVQLKDVYHSFFASAKIVDQGLFDIGEKMIEDYAKDSDNGNKIIALEQDFQLYLDNGVPIKGFIDRVDEISEDEIEIIDYKTGRSYPKTPDQLEYDLQLGMYNLAAKMLFPKYKKIKLTLDYMYYGKVSVYRTDESLDGLKAYLSIIYQKVQALKNGETKPETNLSALCTYCQFKKSCNAFSSVALVDGRRDEEVANKLILPKTGMVVDFEVLDKFRAAVKAKISILKKVEEGINDVIKMEAAKASTGTVKIGETNFKISSNKNTVYKASTVAPILQDKGADLDRFLTVKKKEVDAFLKDDEKSMEKIIETATIEFTDPFVRGGK